MTDKPKLSIKESTHLEYILQHCIPRGIHQFGYAIKIWIKLLQGDYSDYLVYKGYSESEYFQMLRDEFWGLLEDDILEKELYDLLKSRAYEVEMGLVETIPWEEFDWEELENDL